jgi:hypothetical protein
MKKLWLLSFVFILLSGCNPSVDSVQPKHLDANEEFGEEHLYVLGKVWGFLKYYHPNVATGQFDWDEELLKIIPDILESKNPQERDKILTTWINGLGNFETEKKQVVDQEIIIKPDLDWITNLDLDKTLQTKLKDLINAKRPSEHYYVSLAENVGNPVFNEASYDSMNYLDEGYRLLSLYRYWNIIEYFFPYKSLIEEDWDNVLQEFIPKYISASNEGDYKLTTLELIGRIHDTHANIWTEDPQIIEFWGVNSSPLKLSFVENEPVVIGYYEEAFGEQSGLLKGDVIRKINDKPVEDILREKLKYVPASNYPTKLRDMATKLLRTNDNSIKIEYLRDGKTQQVKIETYPLPVLGITDHYYEISNKESFQLLNTNIAYIFPGSLHIGDIPDIMAKVQDTKGLIIDLRRYPAEFIVYVLSEYLLPEKQKFSRISVCSPEKPGLFKVIADLEVGKNNPEYYKGKVVILVNEHTQSLAEFSAMAFRKAPRATVIGSTTAGADGNISPFSLPGGINTAISGIGVYNPDGTDTQRIGIIPDIHITPTLEGIKQNKDELLEEAITLINNELKE